MFRPQRCRERRTSFYTFFVKTQAPLPYCVYRAAVGVCVIWCCIGFIV